jgi:hypothetical protein
MHPDIKKNIDNFIESGKFEFIKQVDSLALLKCKEK